ncbi:hypothetical protein HDV00_001301 [Rhizophlyctis rosea]|nr:hypothetical protein HDV00_001301 [Rhizophlyctis rosea]
MPAIMEVEGSQVPTKPLDSAQRQQLLDALILYFSNSELKGTVANIPKGLLTELDWAEGWLPATALLTFKRISSITSYSPYVIEVATTLAPNIFESSPCGTKLRRRTPYDLRDAAIAFAKETIAQNVVEARGFAPEKSSAEVKNYFARFGTVKDVTVMNNPAEKVYAVAFEDPQVMIKVLASSHKYEDSKIHVSGRSATSPETQSTTAPRPLETRSKIHTFARNRVLRFKLPDPDTPPSHQSLKTAFETLSPVTSIDLDRGASIGHVRFKRGVAKDVIPIAMRQGGLVINGEVLELTALTEEEDRLYWEVSQERERQVPEAVKKAIQAATQKAQQRRHAQGRKAKGKKGSARKGAETVINVHGKRALDGDGEDEEMGGGEKEVGGAAAGRKVASVRKGRGGAGGGGNSNKRVKIDPLESLLSTMQLELGGDGATSS